MSHCGKRVCFHGSYTSKAKAVRKEKSVHGFIRAHNVRGTRRYYVMTSKRG